MRGGVLVSESREEGDELTHHLIISGRGSGPHCISQEEQADVKHGQQIDRARETGPQNGMLLAKITFGAFPKQMNISRLLHCGFSRGSIRFEVGRDACFHLGGKAFVRVAIVVLVM